MSQRISIVGTSGSGKTALAKQIAQQLQIPHVELDFLHWEPDWVEASDQVFRERVNQALQGDRWVVDGNYSKVRDLTWGRADTIVWLDYSFGITFRRILYRTIRRSATQETLWHGNRETWQKSFFSRDSIILWMLRTYHRRRKEYPLLLQQPEYAHLKVVRLTHPRMAQVWLSHLGATRPGAS